jgi:hypothetical protein
MDTILKRITNLPVKHSNDYGIQRAISMSCLAEQDNIWMLFRENGLSACCGLLQALKAQSLRPASFVVGRLDASKALELLSAIT